MARQKPEKVARSLAETSLDETEDKEGVKCSPQAANECEESKGTDLDGTPESADEVDDIPDMTPEELQKAGRKFEVEQDYDLAVQYFEWAVRKKYAEITSGGAEDVSELDPRMGEYWLYYGDAVFTRLEATEELLNVEKPETEEQSPEADDDKKLAWDTMDTARVCLQNLIEADNFPKPINHGDEDLVKWLESRINQSDEAMWPLRDSEVDDNILHSLKLARYCRMRLGDFNMGFAKYSEAVEEFCAALAICRNYGLEYSKGLEVTLPLAQCLMAIQAPTSMSVFKACLRLIDDEKKYQSPDAKRLELLNSTYDDLVGQLAEYENTKADLRDRVREAIAHVQGGAAQENDNKQPTKSDETTSVIDLGVISKKRRRDEASSTQATQAEHEENVDPSAAAIETVLEAPTITPANAPQLDDATAVEVTNSF